MKKVLMVAAEGLPYIKSGGLADVIGSLPTALMKQGLEVKVVLPLYGDIIDKYFNEFKLETKFQLKVAKFNHSVRVFSHQRGLITTYFIENAAYFERDQMYGYQDDGDRYAFFQHAVFKMMEHLKYHPDIIHAHDWHTGMMAVLGKDYYKLKDTRYIYTIHNLAYQGNFPKEILRSAFDLAMTYYDHGTLAFHQDMISFMKAAILYSNKINTVSNTYAAEILTSEYGENMEYVLKQREHDLWGIVNGIDTDNLNPATDELIFSNYTPTTLSKRAQNKKALQEKLGLRVDRNVCLVGMVSRLTWQKGVQLILNRLKDIMGLDIQLVILGSGEPAYEYGLRQAEYMYRRRMVFYGGYDEALAHQIYASADLFLMPSLFEPCGLSQLISMRYGALPIVRETGGLKDTVLPYNQYQKTGRGFSFAGFNEEELFHVLKLAVNLFYENKKDFKMLQRNAFKYDVSWDKSAVTYLKMYQEAMK